MGTIAITKIAAADYVVELRVANNEDAYKIATFAKKLQAERNKKNHVLPGQLKMDLIDD